MTSTTHRWPLKHSSHCSLVLGYRNKWCQTTDLNLLLWNFSILWSHRGLNTFFVLLIIPHPMASQRGLFSGQWRRERGIVFLSDIEWRVFFLTIVILRMLRPTASPSELFLQRKVCTGFDLLYPDLKSRVVSKQEDQKRHAAWNHSRFRNLLPGEAVVVRDFRHKKRDSRNYNCEQERTCLQ